MKFKNEQLGRCVRHLTNHGFRVFARPCSSTDTVEQLFFVKNDKIGTCYTSCGEFRFSTVHKPDKTIGAGFVVSDREFLHETAEASLAFAPEWVGRDAGFVKKYANWAEYDKKNEYTELFGFNTPTEG